MKTACFIHESMKACTFSSIASPSASFVCDKSWGLVPRSRNSLGMRLGKAG